MATNTSALKTLDSLHKERRRLWRRLWRKKSDLDKRLLGRVLNDILYTQHMIKLDEKNEG